MTKPYCIGGTISDNILENRVGGMNTEACQRYGMGSTNVLEFAFAKHEQRVHEAQKPVSLVSFLIDLTTLEGQTVLDPFMGSGTTAVAAKRLNRRFVGFEAVDAFHRAASRRLHMDAEVGDQVSESPSQAYLLQSARG